MLGRYASKLPDCNTVRPRRSGLEREVEIELEASVQNQIVVCYARDVDLVIALGMHLAEAVFVQKVIADDQAPFVGGERNVMRPGARSELEHLQHARLLRIGNIEHYHFACLIHRDEETTAVTGHAHQLRPTALADGAEVEHRPRGCVPRVQKIQLVIEHSGGIATLSSVTGNQLDVDRATGGANDDGADDFPAVQVPHAHAATQVEVPG